MGIEDKITNRFLAVLLLFSIIFSLTGFLTLISDAGSKITGAATSPEALARINVTTRASVNWTVTTIDWGTGYVAEGKELCILDTEGTNAASNCTDFDTVSEGLRLENNGNKLVSLNISSNVTPAQLLGGTDPGFMWKLANNESDSCGVSGASPLNCDVDAGALKNTTWTAVDTTGNFEICPCLNFNDTNDKLNTELMIKIPSDSAKGVREAIITMVATAI